MGSVWLLGISAFSSSGSEAKLGLTGKKTVSNHSEKDRFSHSAAVVLP